MRHLKTWLWTLECSTIHPVDELLLVRPTIHIQIFIVGLFDNSPSRRIVACRCPTDNPYLLTACSTIHPVDELLLVRPTIRIH